MEEIIFLNNKFLTPKEAKVSVLAPGFLYGWGLFETMRAYKKRIVYLPEHLERLKKSAKLLDLACPYPLLKLKEIIQRIVEICGFSDARIRINLWRPQTRVADILITARKYLPYPSGKYKSGFRLCLSNFRQSQDSFLTQLKTMNYLLYGLAYTEAREKGFDEAIILNQRGYITEASRSNIFLVRAKELFTPALKCGCMDGITRKVIFDLAKKYNIKIYEGKFSLQDLYKADEAFLTNSLIGVMPVAPIEKKRIAKGSKLFRMTEFFLQKYNLLLRHGT